MKKLLACLLGLLMVTLSCKRSEEEELPQGTYDYLIRSWEDIIHPPSGTENAWITIIGGNHTGQYYVSPSGNDNNPGTRDRPFKSIAYAVTRLQPGDTLVILASNINERPIIAGQDSLECAIDISGCRYLRIENLEITSNYTRPFWDGIAGLMNPVEHVILKDLYIHHIDGMGINIADANHLQIINCRITYCGFGSIGGPEARHGGWRNILIYGCDLSYSGHYFRGTSRSPYDRPDGFGIESSEGPIEIRNTVASHNYGDGLDSKANRTYIHECIVANNSCDGVKLWGDSSRVVNTLIYGRGDRDPTHTPWSPICISTEHPNYSFEIINCTVDDSLGHSYLLYAQYDERTIPINLRIVNTIFCSRGEESTIIWLAPSVNYDIRYNLFYGPNVEDLLISIGDSIIYTSSEVERLGEGNIYGNPRFVRTAWGEAGDYHLRSDSPAINAGTSLFAPGIDLDGKPRPQGAGVDIGCYEQ